MKQLNHQAPIDMHGHCDRFPKLLKGLILLGYCLISIACSEQRSDPAVSSEPGSPPLAALAFDHASLDLPLLPRSYPLAYVITPADADTSDLRWHSDAPDIVSVEEGIVTPLSLGETRVQVSKADDTILAELQISIRPARIYSIGNSHSWDLSPSLYFRELASAQGYPIENDWHIHCGNNMASIIANPTATCVPSEHGNYSNALNNEQWDIITLQPYIGGTGATELQAIKQMLSLIESTQTHTPEIYIYTTWPTNTDPALSGFDYQSAWNSAFHEGEQLRTLNAGFVGYLKTELLNGDYPVTGFIEAGQTLADFEHSEITGFNSSAELYRDAAHMNNVGRFLAGLSFFATLYGASALEPFNYGVYPASSSWPTDRSLTRTESDLLAEWMQRIQQTN